MEILFLQLEYIKVAYSQRWHSSKWLVTPTRSLSPNFILPENHRPRLSQISTLDSIPIVDLNDHDTNDLVRKISQASEVYGFFQIINHGVPEELCNRMMSASTQFFKLSAEEKAQYFTTDHTRQVKLFNYFLKIQGQDKVLMWSETFSHLWHPTNSLPQNPPQYREVFVTYAKKVGTLMSRLMGLLSLGLGLEKDCLQNKLGEDPTLKAQANYYPPSPDPELTLGLAVHTDLNALTVLRQTEGVSGLQVIKDGHCVRVDPLPSAFVINLGDQIQILSNGRYKSVHHRAVTNDTQPRLSKTMFYGPNKDTLIGPVEELIDKEHPPLYRSYHYAEFLEEFFRQEGTRRLVKEVFELHHK